MILLVTAVALGGLATWVCWTLLGRHRWQPNVDIWSFLPVLLVGVAALLGTVVPPWLSQHGLASPRFPFPTTTDVLLLPFDLIVRADSTSAIGYGMLGIIASAALFAPAVPGLPAKLRVAMFVICGGAAYIWMMAPAIGDSRYLLPLLPAMVVTAISPLPKLLRSPRGSYQTSLVFFCSVLGLLYFTATLRVTHRSRFELPESYPFQYILGLESKEQFLSRAFKVYSSLEFIDNQEIGNARVLSAGAPFHFYTKTELDDVLGLGGWPAMRDALSNPLAGSSFLDLGYALILVDWARISPVFNGSSETDLRALRDDSRLEFAHRGVGVYRIFSEHVTAGANQANVLRNGRFDLPGAENEVESWTRLGAPQFVRDQSGAHSGPTYVRVGGNNAVAQVFDAAPSDLYTFRVWARSPARGQKVQLETRWMVLISPWLILKAS